MVKKPTYEGLERRVEELERVANKLAESEERFRWIAENIGEAFYLKNMSTGSYEYANPASDEIFGVSREKLYEDASYVFSVLLHPGDRERVNAAVQRQDEQGEWFNEEYRILCPDGTLRWIWARSFPVYDVQGQVSHIVGIAEDITERKRAEEALRESEEKFSKAFHLAPEPMGITTLKEGRFIDVNESYARTYGYKREEVIGHTTVELGIWSSLKERNELARMLREHRIIHPTETVFSTKSGEKIITLFSATIIDLGGEPCILSSLKDITERKQAEEALREAEEFKFSLLNNASHPILVINQDTSIRFVNPALELLTGFTSAEIIGMKAPYPWWPEETTQKNGRDLEKAMSRGIVKLEGLFQKKNGERFWVEVTSGPVRHNGEFRYHLSNWVDITERKQAEEALRESEEKFSKAFHMSPNAMALTTLLDGTFIDVNEGFLRTFGYQRDETIGHHSTALNLWPSEEARAQMAQILMDSGAVRNLETQWHTKSGELRDVLFSAETLELGGEPCLVAAIIDITERKRAEEQLLLVESAVKASVSGVSITDLSGKLTYVNPALVDMFGYDNPEEMLGKNVTSLAKETGKAQSAMKAVVASKVNTVAELIGEKKDGTKIIVELMASIIRDVRGQPIGIVASLLDITERKQMEQELQKADKLESVATLASGIAHDFNNILTGIMGNIGLAMRHVEPKSKAEERLLEAEKASHRARDLTQQLLTFARGGAPVKITAAIARLLKESADFALRGSNVRCDFDIPDDLWSVYIDEGQINQVIANLVINAGQAMPEGGVINIRARNTVIKRTGALPLPKGNYIEILIEDHGVGISKEHLDRIFDPYFTTKQKGSGLGLAVTYSIIHKHNGHITVTSQRDAGTTFYIYLPAAEEQVSAKKKKIEEAPARGVGKVLVMDDEEVIREMLDKMLPLAGYEVILTKDGAEAIEQYTKAREAGKPFDAVIMDLTIPGGMGGKKAIEKLLDIDPGVKVIVSSGYATDPIMSDYKKYGFSAVVTKPYSVGELEKTLHKLLSKKK